MTIKVLRPVDGINLDKVEYYQEEGKDVMFESAVVAGQIMAEVGVTEADAENLWIETEDGERVPLLAAMEYEVTHADAPEEVSSQTNPVSIPGLDLGTLSLEDLRSIRKQWGQEGYKLFDGLKDIAFYFGQQMDMSGDPWMTKYWFWHEGNIVINLFVNSNGKYNTRFRDYEQTMSVHVYVGELEVLPTPNKRTANIRIATHEVASMGRVLSSEKGTIIQGQDPRYGSHFVPGKWIEKLMPLMAKADLVKKKDTETAEQKERNALLTELLYKEDI
jgi:hypothetical protein